MKPVTKSEAAKIIKELGGIVERASGGGALRGLTAVTGCFAGLLDVYAQPNEVNPAGMCDDPVAFRKHFAEILVTTPVLRKKAGRVHA
jgi:hypothetical protein